MKRTILTLLVIAIGFQKSSNACIDYATSIYVTCDYDNNLDNVLITVHNMELFGGPNGAFCTCALNNWTDIYSDITYIALVDSGTLDPVDVFDPWEFSQEATDAWGYWSPFSWDGFLSEVVNPMVTGTPVELIIRAQLPPGWTFNTLDTSLVYTTIGTDEWDPVNDTLALSHYQILSITSGGAPTYVLRDQSYFDSADLQITGISDLESANFELYPNPVDEQLTIRFRNSNSSNGTIEIYSVLGQAVLRKSFYEIDQLIELDVNDLSTGMYSVSITSERYRSSRKLIKY